MSIFKKIFTFLGSFALLALMTTSIISPLVTTNAQDGIKTPAITELCNGSTCPGGINATDATALAGENGVLNLLLGIANFITFIAGGIAVIAMVIGGIYYITANGDEEKASKGKSILINASIGLAVTIVAYTIVFLISSALGNSAAGGGFFSNFF